MQRVEDLFERVGIRLGGVVRGAPAATTGAAAEEENRSLGPAGRPPPGDRPPRPALSDEDLDLYLMVGMDSPSELPGFADFLDNYSDVIDPPTPAPGPAEVEAFLAEAGRRGLVKHDRPLSIREFLGAFMPRR